MDEDESESDEDTRERTVAFKEPVEVFEDKREIRDENSDEEVTVEQSTSENTEISDSIQEQPPNNDRDSTHTTDNAGSEHADSAIDTTSNTKK